MVMINHWPVGLDRHKWLLLAQSIALVLPSLNFDMHRMEVRVVYDRPLCKDDCADVLLPQYRVGNDAALRVYAPSLCSFMPQAGV